MSLDIVESNKATHPHLVELTTWVLSEKVRKRVISAPLLHRVTVSILKALPS